MVSRILLGLVVLVVAAVGIVYWLGTGGLGRHWGAGRRTRTSSRSH